MAVTDKDACAFYASDYHMEMIMLPYINESLNKNKKVYVFTQNNLEDTINHFIKNVNTNNVQKMADLIMSEAIDNSYGIAKDDMSVIVLKIVKKAK